MGILFDAFTTDSRYEKRSGSAGRGTSPLCTVVGGRAAYSGHDKRSGSAGRKHKAMYA